MKRAVAAVTVVVVLALTRSASGDDALDKREAQRHFADGLRAYDVAEFRHDRAMYDTAYEAFAQSYALNPTDKVLWNLALSEVNSGRYLKGLAHLRLYDEHQHVSAQPAHARSGLLRGYLARAMAGTAHIAIDAPAGTPITIDGVAVGVAPVPIQDMVPGTHVVEALGQHSEAKVAAGQVMAVTVAVPAPAASAPPVVLAPPPSHDAVARPTAPPTNHAAREIVRWSASGTAVVALGLGVAFLVDANGRAREIGAFRSGHPGACAAMSASACQQTQSMQSGYSVAATASQVSFVVGAIGAAAAVAAWALWPSGNVRVVPEAADHRAALWLTGSF